MNPPDLIRRRPDMVYGPSILDGERHARCVECKALLEDDREAWFFGASHVAVFFCDECKEARSVLPKGGS